jgi:hypothetical protein
MRIVSPSRTTMATRSLRGVIAAGSWPELKLQLVSGIGLLLVKAHTPPKTARAATAAENAASVKKFGALPSRS